MISDRGYWIGSAVAQREHFYDEQLGKALVAFFLREEATVVDFGCGLGDYVRALRGQGVECWGYDGNPATQKLTNGLCETLDLSQPCHLGRTFDWVLSLEVGEHIPKQFEPVFLENLHKHNRRGIVVSWALPGQGGYGHFNERNNTYIKERFSELGYTCDETAELTLREQASFDWFKQSLMVFRRRPTHWQTLLSRFKKR